MSDTKKIPDPDDPQKPKSLGAENTPGQDKRNDREHDSGSSASSETTISKAVILFPKDEKDYAHQRKKESLSLIPTLLILSVMVGFFYLGHSSHPENVEESKKIIIGYFDTIQEVSKPYRKQVEELVEEISLTIDSKMGRGKPAGAAMETSTKSGSKKKPARKIKYWVAPMDPAYIRNKPGKSPMGMDLIPVYEDEGGQGAGIKIDPVMAQNIGVKTELVKRRTLTHEIRTVGSLTFDERKVTHVQTKYEGWIENLFIDFVGKFVAKGYPLVEIYSPELVATQEELILALKYNEILKNNPFPEIARGAGKLYESTLRRLQLFDMPKHQIDDLIRTRKVKKTIHVHSPVEGYVIDKPAIQGSQVKPGFTLYTIADLSTIWVLADIYEYEMPWLQVGQDAEMELPYFPGKIYKGEVTFIYPVLNPKTRTIKVRLDFENPDGDLRPEMYANVVLKSVVSREGVAVPEEAVIQSGQRNTVMVKNRDGRFESRNLILGAKAGKYYQVLRGLNPGERVVTSSNFLIDSESKLKDALRRMEVQRTSMEESPGMQPDITIEREIPRGMPSKFETKMEGSKGMSMGAPMKKKSPAPPGSMEGSHGMKKEKPVAKYPVSTWIDGRKPWNKNGKAGFFLQYKLSKTETYGGRIP